jgi:MFS family permease
LVNAYQLAVTISLLPFASLGELRGYRRVFVGGLAVFTLGSLACALSGSLNALVASRIPQGFGGAGLMSVNTALLRFIYPADQLGRGVGINALVGSTSAAIGPSVAAGILSIASWQWLFAINVPLGVVALVLARRALPQTPLAGHRFDWLSAVLSALTLGALIIGIDDLRRLSTFVVRARGCGCRRCTLRLAAAPAGLPDAGARALCAAGVRALGSELDPLVHRAEPDLCLAAVLPRGGARPIGGRDRPLDDPLIVGAGLAAAGAVASSLRLFGFRQAEPPPPCWPDGLKVRPWCFSGRWIWLPVGPIYFPVRPLREFALRLVSIPMTCGRSPTRKPGRNRDARCFFP